MKGKIGMDDASLKLAEIRKICRDFQAEQQGIDQILKKLASPLFLGNSLNGRKRFSDIAGLLTEDAVELNYSLPEPVFSLQELSETIFSGYDTSRLWVRIFELREHIPAEVVFYFWHECAVSRVPIDHPLTRYCGNCYQAVKKNGPSPEDDLLIDSPVVRARYCKARNPGWEMLRYLEVRRTALRNVPEGIRRAIGNDSVEAFLIFREMTGIRLSYGLLAKIMREKALKIFAELLKDGEIFRKVIPRDELCVCCATQFEDALSVPRLEIVDELFPGAVKDVRDRWGRNLLWYAAANRRTVFFHPFCRLTPFLLKCGCDPENGNQLGISWRYMLNHLSYLQKASLLEARQRENGRISPVKRDQPLYALADRSYEPQWLKELYGDR